MSALEYIVGDVILGAGVLACGLLAILLGAALAEVGRRAARAVRGRRGLRGGVDETEEAIVADAIHRRRGREPDRHLNNE